MISDASVSAASLIQPSHETRAIVPITTTHQLDRPNLSIFDYSSSLSKSSGSPHVSIKPNLRKSLTLIKPPNESAEDFNSNEIFGSGPDKPKQPPPVSPISPISPGVKTNSSSSLSPGHLVDKKPYNFTVDVNPRKIR